jgi:hypothetical protein
MEINDFSAIISGLGGLAVSTGITMWVYKTLNATITNLRDEIKGLKEQILEIRNSEAKWYHKTHKLASILNRTKHCKNNEECSVRAEYEKYMEDEGII